MINSDAENKILTNITTWLRSASNCLVVCKIAHVYTLQYAGIMNSWRFTISLRLLHLSQTFRTSCQQSSMWIVCDSFAYFYNFWNFSWFYFYFFKSQTKVFHEIWRNTWSTSWLWLILNSHTSLPGVCDVWTHSQSMLLVLLSFPCTRFKNNFELWEKLAPGSCSISWCLWLQVSFVAFPHRCNVLIKSHKARPFRKNVLAECFISFYPFVIW